jgi:hypothetical protein
MLLIVSTALALAAGQPPPQVQQGGAPSAPNTTTTCRFRTGPLAGQTRDFAGVTGFKPFAAGAPCTDGKDSLGVAVDDRAGPSPSAQRAGADAAASTYRCRFTAGPQAGRTAELPMPRDGRPQPGAACTDGAGNHGVAR